MLKNIGDIIDIIDDIDYEVVHSGTVRKIEPDDEIEGLFFYYIRANDESMNTNYDPQIGSFWRVIESCSNKTI